ncbi:hypothetical protein [Clostridium estertheticum]|uniref:hypothetical protein n=1 Tax=Clostridium estertheticum TaxID=238834 RepID=UPI001CF2F109|nr:hypothetical protein [Clostridium estertheticum]MCB2340907.1 hypothetical protein [Clostridium estertheticum]
MSDIADSIINIEMRERNANNNGWIIEHPLTIGGNVSIADASNVFTATNVEGALSELFTNASSGKSLVKTAITGKGGTLVDANGDGIYTHQELANGVNTIKQGGGNAIETDVVSGKTFTNADGVLRTGVGDVDLIPNNIINTANIFGTQGTVIDYAKYEVSDKDIFSNTTTLESSSTTPTLVRSIRINFKGSVRVTFRLACVNQYGYPVYGQIYKNGLPIGIKRSISNYNYDGISYTEDFNISAGDQIRLYLWMSVMYIEKPSKCNSFSIRGNWNPLPIGYEILV